MRSLLLIYVIGVALALQRDNKKVHELSTSSIQRQNETISGVTHPVFDLSPFAIDVVRSIGQQVEDLFSHNSAAELAFYIFNTYLLFCYLFGMLIWYPSRYGNLFLNKRFEEPSLLARRRDKQYKFKSFWCGCWKYDVPLPSFPCSDEPVTVLSNSELPARMRSDWNPIFVKDNGLCLQNSVFELFVTSVILLPVRWADNSHRTGYVDFRWGLFIQCALLYFIGFSVFLAPLLLFMFVMLYVTVLATFRTYLRCGPFPDYPNQSPEEEDIECCEEVYVPGLCGDMLNCCIPCLAVFQEAYHIEYLARCDELLRRKDSMDFLGRIANMPVAAPVA